MDKNTQSQLEGMNLSNEGIKEIFRAIHDKWKEWFPTTYWTVEGAENGRNKKLLELGAIGTLGPEFVALIKDGMFKNADELNRLTYGIKSSKPARPVADFTKNAISFMSTLNNQRRLRHGTGTMAVYRDLVNEDEVKAAKEFMEITRFFSDGKLLERYENAVTNAHEALQSLYVENSTLFATISAGLFVKSAKGLPQCHTDSEAFLMSYFNQRPDESSPASLEAYALSYEYNKLFYVINYFCKSGAWSRVQSMLAALSVESFANEEGGGDEKPAIDPDLLRLCWNAFGMDFEANLQEVTEQLRNADRAMSCVARAGRDFLRLHRLLLEAQIAFIEATIRRLRAADVSMEAFAPLAMTPRSFNIPATFQLAPEVIRTDGPSQRVNGVNEMTTLTAIDSPAFFGSRERAAELRRQGKPEPLCSGSCSTIAFNEYGQELVTELGIEAYASVEKSLSAYFRNSEITRLTTESFDSQVSAKLAFEEIEADLRATLSYAEEGVVGMAVDKLKKFVADKLYRARAKVLGKDFDSVWKENEAEYKEAMAGLKKAPHGQEAMRLLENFIANKGALEKLAVDNGKKLDIEKLCGIQIKSIEEDAPELAAVMAVRSKTGKLGELGEAYFGAVKEIIHTPIYKNTYTLFEVLDGRKTADVSKEIFSGVELVDTLNSKYGRIFLNWDAPKGYKQFSDEVEKLGSKITAEQAISRLSELLPYVEELQKSEDFSVLSGFREEMGWATYIIEEEDDGWKALPEDQRRAAEKLIDLYEIARFLEDYPVDSHCWYVEKLALNNKKAQTKIAYALTRGVISKEGLVDQSLNYSEEGFVDQIKNLASDMLFNARAKVLGKGFEEDSANVLKEYKEAMGALDAVAYGSEAKKLLANFLVNKKALETLATSHGKRLVVDTVCAKQISTLETTKPFVAAFREISRSGGVFGKLGKAYITILEEMEANRIYEDIYMVHSIFTGKNTGNVSVAIKAAEQLVSRLTGKFGKVFFDFDHKAFSEWYDGELAKFGQVELSTLIGEIDKIDEAREEYECELVQDLQFDLIVEQVAGCIGSKSVGYQSLPDDLKSRANVFTELHRITHFVAKLPIMDILWETSRAEIAVRKARIKIAYALTRGVISKEGLEDGVPGYPPMQPGWYMEIMSDTGPCEDVGTQQVVTANRVDDGWEVTIDGEDRVYKLLDSNYVESYMGRAGGFICRYKE